MLYINQNSISADKQIPYAHIIIQKMNLISTLIISKKVSPKLLTTPLKQHSQVDGLLSQILGQKFITPIGTKLKQIYTLLETVIYILSTKKGPKAFKMIIDDIFQFIKDFSYDRIRAYQEEIVILNLTYYERLFRNNLSIKQKLQIIIILAATNIHVYLKTLNPKILPSVESKLNSMQPHALNIFSNILTLLQGITTHLKGQYKKAKPIFSNLITKIISQNKQMDKSPQCVQIMAILCFYCSLNMWKLGEYELIIYYLAKSEEFGDKLPTEAKFTYLQKVTQIKEIFEQRIPSMCQLATKHIKLTRIQHNLQLHKKKQKPWNTKTETKLYTNVHKNSLQNQFEKHNEKIITEELNNIFTIKDTKATMYKLRKDNLRYLAKEEVKLMESISCKEHELGAVSLMQNMLDRDDGISRINKNITLLSQKKKQIYSEYQSLKQNHLESVKPTKILQAYFQTLISLLTFQKQSYIYNFLHGKMMSTAKIYILNQLMRRRLKKFKKSIKKSKVMFKGVLHFVELYEIVSRPGSNQYRGKQVGFYLTVYPLVRGPAQNSVEDYKKIDINLCHQLMTVPFYFEFDVKNTKLVTWNQYINKKNLLVVYFVRKFIHILSKKWKDKNMQQQERFQKIEVKMKFRGTVIIESTLFGCIKKMPANNLYLSIQQKKQRYQAFLFTIGQKKYQNNLYNLKINKTLILIDVPRLSLQNCQQIIQQQFLKNLQMSPPVLQSIKRIQRFIKYINCRKKVKLLRSKCKIVVFVNIPDVYCYFRTLNDGREAIKSYIVVENIINKERQSVDTMMDFILFKQIHSIKDKLHKQRTCKDKLKLTFKFMWIKYFIMKLKNKYRQSIVVTDFQISFRNRIIFSKIFNGYLYKRKNIAQKIVFTLIVQNLIDFPRPYIFRIFSLHKGQKSVNIQYKIYNREKLFYQKNVNRLNQIINIVNYKQMEVLNQNEKATGWMRRVSKNNRNSFQSRNNQNSRNSLLKSNSNFASQDEINSDRNIQIKMKMLSKKCSILNRLKNRHSYQLTQQKNSIFSSIKSTNKNNQDHTQYQSSKSIKQSADQCQQQKENKIMKNQYERKQNQKFPESKLKLQKINQT